MEDYLVGKDQREEGGRQKRRMRVNRIKLHCTHVWKCHNETHYFVQQEKKVLNFLNSQN
jgi:hypothetical protein